MTTQSRTVMEGLASTASEAGVKTTFGLVGTGNYEFVQKLQSNNIEYFASSHDSGAVAMADGYARATGRIGFASISQGPGLTNILAALTEAVKSGTPMVVCVASAQRLDLNDTLQIDQDQLVSVIGAGVDRVRDASTAVEDLRRSFRRARTERRPIVFMIPTDVQYELDTAPQNLQKPEPWTNSLVPHPSTEAVARLADALEAAEHPIIVAGRGAVLSNAKDSLIALGERVGALLATSAVAKDAFRGHEYDLGIMGHFANNATLELVPKADLVIAFGAALNAWSGREMFAPGTRIIQVDSDATALGLQQRLSLGVLGDARITAESTAAELDRRGYQSNGYRTDDVRKVLNGPEDRAGIAASSSEQYCDPYELTVALEKMVPAERLLTVDSGHFMGWVTKYMRVEGPEQFFYPQAFQCVGLSVGVGTGAGIGVPDRLSVVCFGDGAARMSFPEVETAVRYKIPMLFVIFNDASYGAEVHRFGPEGLDTELAQFRDCDFASVARGFGAAASTVRSVSDLGELQRWLEHCDGPMVLDCKIDPTVAGEWSPGERHKMHVSTK